MGLLIETALCEKSVTFKLGKLVGEDTFFSLCLEIILVFCSPLTILYAF